jgi:hypothetical protein
MRGDRVGYGFSIAQFPLAGLCLVFYEDIPGILRREDFYIYFSTNRGYYTILTLYENRIELCMSIYKVRFNMKSTTHDSNH